MATAVILNPTVFNSQRIIKLLFFAFLLTQCMNASQWTGVCSDHWNDTGKRHATSSTKRIPAKLSQSWTSAVSFGMLGSVLSPLQTSVVGLRKQECSRLIKMQCLSLKTAPYVQAVVLMVTVIMLMVAVGMVSTLTYLHILYMHAHSHTHSHLHSPAHTLSHAHPHALHAYTHLHSSTHTYPHTPIHKHAYVYVHATSFIHCY